MMDTIFVGLDAHRDMIHVAVLIDQGQPPLEWQVAHDARTVRRLARRLQEVAPGSIRCCYEAGPCGYALQRELQAVGID